MVERKSAARAEAELRAEMEHEHAEAWRAEVARLQERVGAFEAVGRRLLAAHVPGYVSLMQEDADELRRLLGIDPDTLDEAGGGA